MHPLRLDYRANRRTTKQLAYALAVISVAFAFDVGYRYQALRTQVAVLESRLPRLPTFERRRSAAVWQRVSADELDIIRGTGRQLNTPWTELFRSLEAARADGVALLSLEPDARERTLTLSAEAKDYLAALTYVSALGEQKALRDVRLTRHETRAGLLRIAFTVSARWGDAQ